jgi:hypothetical protein
LSVSQLTVSWHSSPSLSAAAACFAFPTLQHADVQTHTQTYRDVKTDIDKLTKETDKGDRNSVGNATGLIIQVHRRVSGQKKRERIRCHNHKHIRSLCQFIIKKAGEWGGRRLGRRRKTGLEHTASNYARHVLLHSVRANPQSTPSSSMGAGCKS